MRLRPPFLQVCVGLLVGLLAFTFAPIAHAQGRAECATFPSTILSRNVRYCAYLPASFDTDKSKHYPVLYYLHGLGDNEQSLLNTGGWALMRDLRRPAKLGNSVFWVPVAEQISFSTAAAAKIPSKNSCCTSSCR